MRIKKLPSEIKDEFLMELICNGWKDGLGHPYHWAVFEIAYQKISNKLSMNEAIKLGYFCRYFSPKSKHDLEEMIVKSGQSIKDFESDVNKVQNSLNESKKLDAFVRYRYNCALEIYESTVHHIYYCTEAYNISLDESIVNYHHYLPGYFSRDIQKEMKILNKTNEEFDKDLVFCLTKIKE